MRLGSDVRFPEPRGLVGNNRPLPSLTSKAELATPLGRGHKGVGGVRAASKPPSLLPSSPPPLGDLGDEQWRPGCRRARKGRRRGPAYPVPVCPAASGGRFLPGALVGSCRARVEAGGPGERLLLTLCGRARPAREVRPVAARASRGRDRPPRKPHVPNPKTTLGARRRASRFPAV